MFIITIIGTDNSIHTIHHILHQKPREIIITSGLRLSLFHINFGSMIFHIVTCIQISDIMIMVNDIENQNCTKVNKRGNDTAIIDQTVGI